MPSELVTAAQVLAGTGVAAWVADKLLGPSAEALGDQIKIYAGDRLTKIFGRAKEISEGKNIKPLAPGFALVVFQRASFSEDSAELTEMWAHLVANAAQDQTSRHVIYAEILSQIGGEEALLLDQFDVPQGEHFQLQQQHAIGEFRSKIEGSEIVYGYGLEDAAKKIDQLLALESSVAGVISRAEISTKDEGKLFSVSHRLVNAVSLDILERQRLVESLVVQSAHRSDGPKIHYSILTELGADFLRVCRGDRT